MIKAEFKILKLEDIPNHGAIVVDIWPNGDLVSTIVARKNTDIYCYLNRCPHAGWPLENFTGSFIFTPNHEIVCAAHGAIFDVTNGHCLGGPGHGKPLQKFPITINDGFIQIGDEKK